MSFWLALGLLIAGVIIFSIMIYTGYQEEKKGGTISLDGTDAQAWGITGIIACGIIILIISILYTTSKIIL